jgi:hypothetical protein
MNRGHRHSEETKRKMSIAVTGRPRPDMVVNNPMFKKEIREKIHNNALKRNGGSLHYVSSHNRIRLLFGKAKHCENKKCDKKSKVFEWCHIKRKKHNGEKNSYIQLCRSCHRKYDRNIKGFILLFSSTV